MPAATNIPLQPDRLEGPAAGLDSGHPARPVQQALERS